MPVDGGKISNEKLVKVAVYRLEGGSCHLVFRRIEY